MLIFSLCSAVMLMVWLMVSRPFGVVAGPMLMATPVIAPVVLGKDEISNVHSGRTGGSKSSKAIEVELGTSPSSVRAGELVRLITKVRNVSWWIPYSLCFLTDGGRITRLDGSKVVSVNTFGLMPGVYQVKVHLLAGFMPGDRAIGLASFEVV